VKDFKRAESGKGLTRRQWLLVLGGSATVVGLSGVVPELTAALSGAGEQPLPPGLYYPSYDHLFHALGGHGSLGIIPPGTETEYVRATASVFRPQFFSDQEFKTVARIIQILLGKVDANAIAQAVQWFDLYLHSALGVREAALELDVLHRALAVAYYGETTVRELETVDLQEIVRSGLKALQNDSVERYGRKFLLLDEKQQRDLISTITIASPNSSLQKFLDVVRTEAVRGYYTTAAGLKELDYKGNWYYGSCPGCKPNA
jgi:hypothetical protein